MMEDWNDVEDGMAGKASWFLDSKIQNLKFQI